jgi:hypothetical protein
LKSECLDEWNSNCRVEAMQQGSIVNNNKTRSKRRVIIISIISVILVAIAGGLIYWNANKEKIIENKIEEVLAKEEGFYKINYRDLEVNEATGSLFISDMHLTVDSSKYLAAEKNGEVPPLLFSIFIPRLSVQGVKTPKVLIDKEVIGRKLEIINPVVDIQYTYRGKDSIKNIPTTEVYKQLLGNLDLIQIDTVLVKDAQLRTHHRRNGKDIVKVEGIDILLSDIRVDSAAYIDSTRLLFAKHAEFNIGKVSWLSPDGLYDYGVVGMSINSTDQDLFIKQFSINPKLYEDAFVNAVATQVDRFDFTLNNIFLYNVDLQKLKNEYLQASTMAIGQSTFKIYRDLARPRDNKNRVGDYPHQVMDDIPITFSINKLKLNNSFIEYKERNHITRKAGKVQFYNVNATINNFTNDKRNAGEVMKAYITSSFLNKTPLQSSWTFYLFHPKGKFDVRGSVGSLAASELNPLTEPMGPAHLKEGQLKSMNFDLHGNDYSMSGTVKMLYNDLKVDLHELDRGAKETDKKFLTSLLANLVIKDSNPKDDDEEIRVSNVTLQRDTNRSIFYLSWKTLFKGIRQTLGVKA